MANIKPTKVVPSIFALALTISEILVFQIFNLQKSRSRSQSTIFAITPFDNKYQNLSNLLDDSWSIFFLQWGHSMTNIKTYNSCHMHFCANLTVSEILRFQIVYLQKVGHGHGVYFLQWSIRWQIWKPTKAIQCIFALALIDWEIWTFQIVCLKKKSHFRNDNMISFTFWFLLRYNMC